MITRAECRDLDAADRWRDRRRLFDLSEDVIYLDGNSLGPLPHAAKEAVERTVEEWRQHLIEGWWEAEWVDLPRMAGRKLEPLIGASPDSVVFCDSTTVNLYKTVGAMVEITEGDLLTDSGNFPTDLYVLETVARTWNRELRVVPPEGLMEAITESVGVVSLTEVDFRTGRRHDLEAITEAVHEVGGRVVWDLSHSAGVTPVEVERHQVDGAVGCGYKYLNGGPGAPAYVYVAPGLELRNPINGWFSHQAPFDFSPEYVPAPGIDRLRTGTPHVLSLVAMSAALDAFAGVDLEQLRAKSLALTELFMSLVEGQVEVVTPRPGSERGGQVSVRLPNAELMIDQLKQRGVIGDFRPPDIARFGFAPLYIGFEDVWRAAEALLDVR